MFSDGFYGNWYINPAINFFQFERHYGRGYGYSQAHRGIRVFQIQRWNFEREVGRYWNRGLRSYLRNETNYWAIEGRVWGMAVRWRPYPRDQGKFIAIRDGNLDSYCDDTVHFILQFPLVLFSSAESEKVSEQSKESPKDQTKGKSPPVEEVVDTMIEEDTLITNDPKNDEFIKSLQQEIKDYKDRLIRSYAEEENVRRIAKKDVENARNYALSSFAKALLDVSDDLERALDSVPKEKIAENHFLKNLYEGVDLTGKQLQKVLHQFKIHSFGAVGDKFDPTLHDALYQVPDTAKEPGTIAQVLKKGYKLNDRVIRAAQVGTVNGAAKE
ncbi:unnamed protein product [Sphagnum jensenii]|uniref:GrpE protein homolog n=1 Tax=Sphagnum jensenii TaxID=128206 RepID=A0ABP0VDM0_9BRYO